MSAVPYTTQMSPRNSITQGLSQSRPKVILVHHDKMTERQSALMRECQDLLSPSIEISIKQVDELGNLPRKMNFFVIPSLNSQSLLKKIRERFEKPRIYLPKAVIEARGYRRVILPIRHLVVSLTMHDCRIFLVKNCDLDHIKLKINKMCGSLVDRFSQNDPNVDVVVTDTANDKYSSRAFKRNIPVVSTNWVDENYIAAEDESGSFETNAKTNISDYQIKAFYGLHFRILAGTSVNVKKLITDNEGHIIYGNENCLTHIVAPPGDKKLDEDPQSDPANKSSSQRHQGPRVVDEEFLKACVEKGHYMTRREYEHYRSSVNPVIVKQEQLSQLHHISSPHVEQNPTLLTENGYNNNNNIIRTCENHQAMPPPAIPRPLDRQLLPSGNMNDMILQALSTSETAQTQLASTQMRRLPDPEVQMESPSFEASQQLLFWQDSGSRRN